METNDSCNLVDLAIAKQHQKKGYGKKLFCHAIIEAKKLGARKFHLTVREDNLPAISIYNSCHFKIIKKINSYYIDKTNAFVMELCDFQESKN
ncbi:MAG: GNAT family N-acetyltransferase [Oligoflexia bacterium]|nr:GNAT family N-acetyltransferase [Oligoflexia bacterium]